MNTRNCLGITLKLERLNSLVNTAVRSETGQNASREDQPILRQSVVSHVLCAVILMVFVTLGSPQEAEGEGLHFFSNTWGDVIVNTDTTWAGKALTRPTPKEPVYYMGQSLGCKFGAIPGDKVPDEDKMNDFVAEVLAQQGYLGAQDGEHEPSLFIVLQWGCLRPASSDLFWFLGYNSVRDIAYQPIPGFLGPEVFRRNSRSKETEMILSYGKRPIYGIIITAFEYKSAKTTRPIIYWQTRIGLSASGKSMAKALPAMVLAAGPSIGLESDIPIIEDVDRIGHDDAEYGEIKVIGYEDEKKDINKGNNGLAD